MSTPVQTRERVAPTTRRTKAGRVAVHALREIQLGSAAGAAEPTIIERDTIERVRPGSVFAGRVYLVWTEHDPSGGCNRDPITDPHEDLGYVGKTIRELFTRWAEHLAPGKIDGQTGERKKNNSAVYRHRARVTGFSADPRVYDTPEALAAAETRAIKNLWPLWNIQEQDRRNPATRATRSYRRADRLAPLIGLASAAWGALWAALTAGMLWVVADRDAPWYWLVAMPLISLYIVNGAAFRHAKAMTDRARRRR